MKNCENRRCTADKSRAFKSLQFYPLEETQHLFRVVPRGPVGGKC